MRVLVGGVFDIIHPGHIFFLNKAAAMGEELIVVVATDNVARKNKSRKPIFSQDERVEVVQSLDMVSRALPGQEGDFLYVVKHQRPDLIVLGHDQKFPGLEKKLKSAEISAKVVRVEERLGDYSTTKILERICRGVSKIDG